MRRLILVALIACIASFDLGCTTVKVWERGNLAKRCMKPSLDPLESSAEGHVHATREGMAGASVTKGASCGCN